MSTQESSTSGSWEDRFATFASKVSWAAGSPITFALAIMALLGWAACGPFFDYSQGWQLIVNTGTTITTFLMVFVIQNSQNRDGLAAQIKLDEIIRAITGAKNSMIDLEGLTDKELAELRVRFAQIAERARKIENKVISARQSNSKGRAGKAKRKPNGRRRNLAEA